MAVRNFGDFERRQWKGARSVETGDIGGDGRHWWRRATLAAVEVIGGGERRRCGERRREW